MYKNFKDKELYLDLFNQNMSSMHNRSKEELLQ